MISEEQAQITSTSQSGTVSVCRVDEYYDVSIRRSQSDVRVGVVHGDREGQRHVAGSRTTSLVYEELVEQG